MMLIAEQFLEKRSESTNHQTVLEHLEKMAVVTKTQDGFLN